MSGSTEGSPGCQFAPPVTTAKKGDTQIRLDMLGPIQQRPSFIWGQCRNCGHSKELGEGRKSWGYPTKPSEQAAATLSATPCGQRIG